MKRIVINNKKKLGFIPNKSIITPRSEKSVNLYFGEINNLDAALLTKTQEKELFIKIRQGDENAKNKVILSNLKFVISVSKNYINQGLDFEDLINEGNIGLMKAVDMFDHEKGWKFISYAVWWIRQAILQALVDKGKTVRIPINKTDNLNRVNQMISKLEQQLQRKPTINEIVEMAREINKDKNKPDIDADDITNILLSKMTSVSLDEPIYTKNGDEDGSLYDIIPSTGISTVNNLELIENEIRELLSNSNLTKQERNIIELNYGVLRKEKLNLEQISDMYILSRERVRQIRDKALRKLRNNPKIQILFEYTLNND